MTRWNRSNVEVFKYATQHELPLRFIVEDNGKSVYADTRKVWGVDTLTFDGADSEFMYHYKYETNGLMLVAVQESI